MATERSLTVGGGHTTQCVFALLLNCPRETYWIVLINVTIKKKKEERRNVCRRVWAAGSTTASARPVAELGGGRTA